MDIEKINKQENKIIYFETAGDLKEVLKYIPDNRIICCQTIAKDGSAWNQQGSICPKLNNGTVALMQFTHNGLKTLPPIDDEITEYEIRKRLKKLDEKLEKGIEKIIEAIKRY